MHALYGVSTITYWYVVADMRKDMKAKSLSIL